MGFRGGSWSPRLLCSRMRVGALALGGLKVPAGLCYLTHSLVCHPKRVPKAFAPYGSNCLSAN